MVASERSRFKVLTVLLIVAIVIVVPLLTTGCILFSHSDSTYTPKAINDGAGGALVIYEDRKSDTDRDFYAQRISSDAKSLWGEKGTLIGSSKSNSYSLPVFDIVSGGSQGAIIAWPELLGDGEKHLIKINSEGKIIWQRELEYFGQMVPDGAGGAIGVYRHASGFANGNYGPAPLSIIRVDSQGNYPWGVDGIIIPRKIYSYVRVASDNAGGILVVWNQEKGRIEAQRIDASGKLMWGNDGVVLSPQPGANLSNPDIVGDSSGGAILTWQQTPNGKVTSGTPEFYLHDIFVQKIDSNGHLIWQSGGVPLGIVRAAEGASPHVPIIVTDGSEGAIVAWEDVRNGLTSIYAQKIRPDGAAEWQPGGMKVCYIKSNSSFAWRQMITDGTGGAIVSFRFGGGILAQKLDSTGKTVWPDNGVLITTQITTQHFATSDDKGGVIVVWGTAKGLFSSEKSYIQRVDSSGKALLGKDGIELGN